VLDTGSVDREELNARLEAVLIGGCEPAQMLEHAGYVLRVREAGHRMLRTPARDWEDMNHYAEAKGPLIAEILKRATI
jgi:hypothetical protein